MINWTDIPNFTSKLQKKWESKGFSAEETKEWMEFGLEPEETDFADWLKKKYNVTAEEFLGDDDMEELRERYKKEWIDWKYPKEERESIKELYINEKGVEGKLDLSYFPNLEKIFLSHFVDENKLEIKDKEKYENKIIKLVNAQKFLEEYLEKNYSGKQKSEITGTLRIDGKNLEGDLKIENFSELERLDCDTNKLTSLEVIDCPKLKTLYCYSNQLSNLKLDDLPQLELLSCSRNYLDNLDFLNSFNPEKLGELYMYSNNFPEQDLTIFSQFINLKTLKIDNDNKEKIKKGIYNRFYGSLEPLKGLNKLVELNIGSTNIDSGLEFLPESLGTLKCEVISDGVDFRVSGIKEQLSPCDNSVNTWKEWKRRGFDSEEIKQWKEVGLNKNEYNFAAYLKNQKKYDFTKIKAEDIENSKEDFNKWIKIAQNYLSNYLPEEKGKITNLDISNKGLEGPLNLEGFSNLKNLNLANNQITELKLEDCASLENLNCSNNLLTRVNFLSELSDSSKLIQLDIKNNNFEIQDLSFLASFTSLEKLYLGNNDKKKIEEKKYNSFTGSLKHLSSLTSLKVIDINNTDIDSGAEFLSDSTEIYCSSKEKPNSKVKEIREQLVACNGSKYVKKQNVEQWLNENFPKGGKSNLAGYGGQTRGEITKLNISEKGLVGKLDLSDFKNLTDLNCSYNQLTNLVLSGLNNLVNLSCNDNLIEKLDLDSLNPEKLTGLNLKNNNLSEQDLSIFSKFAKLKQLLIGNDNKEKIAGGKYNCFVGSLNDLEGLTNLESLHISNTDINEVDVEELPKSLRISGTYCSTEERPESQVKNIQEKLYSHLTKKRLNAMYPDKSVAKLTNLYSEGLKGHLDLSEYRDLEELRCHNNQLTSIDISKNIKLKKLNCSNNKLKKINLENNINLEAEELKFGGNNFSIDYESFLLKLIEANKIKGKWKDVKAQEWLDKEYRKNDKCCGIFDWENKGKLRKDIEELDISGNELTGELKLEGFSGLKYLVCSNNQLTRIDLSDCSKLVGVDCKNNKLEELKFNEDCNLKELQASDNEFKRITNVFNKIKEKKENKYSAATLNYFNINNNKINDSVISDFDKFENLIILYVGNTDDRIGNEKNNVVKGSLEDLKGLKKLEEVDIRNSGIEITEEFLKEWSKKNVLENLNRIYYSFFELDQLIGSGKQKIKDIGKGTDPEKIKKLVETVKKIETKYIGKTVYNNRKEDIKELEKRLFDLDQDSFRKIIGEVMKKDEEFSSKEDEVKNFDELYELKQRLSDKLKMSHHNYNEKDSFYHKGQEDNEVKSIVKIPNLKVNKGGENRKEVKDYSVDGRLIYPSEEARFNWMTIGELPPSKLPVRLYSIDSRQVVSNDLLSEKKEKLSRYSLEKDFEEKNDKGNQRTSVELYEIKSLLKDIISLESKEEKKYENYLQRISSLQKEVHKNSIKVRTFESLAETDEERIKKWEERHQKEKVNSLYQIYDEYQKIEKLIKLTPQQKDSKKAVRREIKKKENYEDWRNKFKSNSDLSKAFTNEVIDKWKNKDSFDIAGDVKKLFSVIEKNDEFIKEIKEKYQTDSLKDFVAWKSPREIVTIIKHFEYDDKNELEGKVRKFYNKDEADRLTDNQINDYLYKKAVGKIKEEEESDAIPSTSSTKEMGIKRRIECIDKSGENDAKYYAILSYTWDGDAKEDIKWSPENALKRLSPGGKKSLDKALKALKVLNEFHLFKNKGKEESNKSGSEIKYLWMDQLCINQNNPREKQHEVPKMREYYGNSTVTLVAIHDSVGEETMKRLLNSFEKGKSGLIHPNEIVDHSLPILKKIIDSNWFKRSWTYQEGFLSKQTIFMFDDFLIDGRFMALIWKLSQFSEAHYEECEDISELCRDKISTPVGWVYYKDKNGIGYNLSDKASLGLVEALWAVKNRGRSIPQDGVYSIIGLLPYGDKIKVNYGKEPESVLREVMLIAIEEGRGEPLAWYGTGSKAQGLCWMPATDRSSGSSEVRGGISIDYKASNKEDKLFDSAKGIKIKAAEYVITEKDSGIYKLENEEIVDGGLWKRKIWIKSKENDNISLILSGTREGVEAASEGRVLIIPNKEEWKWKDSSDSKQFAILAMKVRSDNLELQVKQLEKMVELETKIDNISEKTKNLQEIIKKIWEKDNVRHRLDLVRIEEGWSNELKKEAENTEKKFIIGLDDQQYQAQIQVDPK